jgi:hypothetical protein
VKQSSIAATFVRVALLAVVLALLPPMNGVANVGAETPIGPGIAGQVHALAYDPSNPDIIYAGGDNCGVYKSTDHGRNWLRWNEGLSDPNPRMTSYVDDLLVVGAQSGVDDDAVGVYAATRGGIAFRHYNGTSWTVQTTSLVYNSGYAQGVGAAIPFCSLAFDPVNKKLYAGAGNGRLSSESPTMYPMYPESGGSSTEYTLWSKSVATGSVVDWQPVTRLTNAGTALQLAVVVSPNNTPRVAVATKNGLYLQQVNQNDWDLVLDEQTFLDRLPLAYSHRTAGVGVGKNGVLYCLARRDSQNDPGVHVLTPTVQNGEYDYFDHGLNEYNWLELGENDVGNVLPQNTETWMNIVHAWGNNDFKYMTVVPGVGATEDEVFVGMDYAIPSGTTSYNSLFRYGKSGNGTKRWLNILFRDSNNSWNVPDEPFKYVNYFGQSLDAIPMPHGDTGWLSCFPTNSTVPMIAATIADPLNPPVHANRMFAPLFHYPFGFELDPTQPLWQQRYCSGSGGYAGYYTSNGLNIMSARTIGFTASGRLVVGCLDLTGFVTQESDPTGLSGFKYMDPYFASWRDCRRVLTIGDEIYVVRRGPTSWAHSTTNSFGFDRGPAGDDAQLTSRQVWVIAQYDETLHGMADNNRSGYQWRYQSQGLDNIIAGTYEVIDIEAVEDLRMFAVVRDTTNNEDYVFRRTRLDSSSPWSSWETWRQVSLSEGMARRIHWIRGTDKLMVVGTGAKCLVELNADEPSTPGGFEPVTWIERPTGAQMITRLDRALQNIEGITCDGHNNWLYLITSGQVAAGLDKYGNVHPYKKYCANVLRARIPEGGGSTDKSDWECLLNTDDGEGIPFAVVDADYWPDNMPHTAAVVAESLPLVHAIAVHPDNPRRLFIGLRAGGFKANENFHPNNGVWEYSPTAEGGQWEQLKGGSTGEPCKGIVTLGLVPGDPSTMIAGSFGQELFRITGISPSPQPVTGVIAQTAIHQDQPLLMVTLVDAGTTSIGEVRVDASALGLEARVTLRDDGEFPDWEAGDGIWTADLAGYETSVYGVISLPVYVRDENWNSFYGDVEVTFLEESPVIYYRNASTDSDLDYLGQPTGVVSFDLPNQNGVIDGQRDVFYSQLGDVGRLYRHYGIREGTADVPSFVDATTEAFAIGAEPGLHHGPATVVDLNNDGLEDLIVASGHNGTFRIYLQNKTAPGTFTALALSQELQNVLSNSWAVACADYNMDGLVDIYVGRASVASGTMPGPSATALPDVLLRNELINSGAFVDSTGTIEFASGSVDLATSSAAWCDFDHDGDMDLIVTDISGVAGIRILVNENGVLQEQLLLVLPQPGIITYPLTDVAWVDIDGDGDFDVVATVHSDEVPTCTFINNNGVYSYVLSHLPVPVAPRSGVRVLDHDRDGYMDVLLLSADSTEPPQLMVNRAGPDNGFRSFSEETGLSVLTGATYGAVVTDLNSNGASDLLLGRAIQDQKFLCTARAGGMAAIGKNWVGLRLFHPEGTGQAAAVGTRVVVQMPDSREQVLQIAGGGNGGADQTALLGIGSATSVTCSIYWPSGRVQTNVVLNANTVNEITESDQVSILTNSTSATYELRPDITIDWVFRWTTDFRTDPQLDKVMLDIEGMGQPCYPDVDELKAGDPNVVVSQWRDATGKFQHELRWQNRPCISPCVYDFEASSSRRLGAIATSETKTLRIRVCPQQ